MGCQGTRVSAVCYADDAAGATIAAFYDGRASRRRELRGADRHRHRHQPAALAATGDRCRGRVAHTPGAGCGTWTVLPLGDGRHRLYYEMTRPDGAHELRTELPLTR